MLGAEPARVFCRVYDVTDVGNFEGRNILNQSHRLEAEAKMLGRQTAELAQRWPLPEESCWPRGPSASGRRATRKSGQLERLAIDALARAGAALGEPRYTAAAGAAADFLLAQLRGDDGRLLHDWRAGRAQHDAYLDDYAALASALLTLYETGGPAARLVRPLHWPMRSWPILPIGSTAVSSTPPTTTSALIVRKKDAIDNPLPSGNGLAATLLLRLQAAGRGGQYRAAAEATLRACWPWMQREPRGTFQLLLAADLLGSQS